MGGIKSKSISIIPVNTITPIQTSPPIRSTTEISHLSTRRSSLIYSSIVQNFLLVWLDENSDEISHENYRNTFIELQLIVHTIDKFNNIEECISFLKQIKDEKVFLIVSDVLGQQILSHIHHIPQLDSIYVLSRNKFKSKQWIKSWPIVKGIYTNITSICDLLKQAAQQCDRNSISMTFIPASNNKENEIFDQVDQTFMYTKIFKEILLEIKYDEDSIREFSNYCHESNYGNIDIIDKFRREYSYQTPIWWYTCPLFLSSMLNRALRTLEVDTIMKAGFFIRDLNEQIRQMHIEQFYNQSISPFFVYRGQGLSKNDFEKLRKAKNGLLSFNNFLSTSRDRDISYVFADSNLANPEMIGVLFKMFIDPSILSTPFACTDNFGHFDQEQEVLFSMHTIFRVVEIKSLYNNDRLWEVELKLTNDNDYQFHELTNKIRWETQGSKGWDRLGRLLFKLGQFNKAEQVYRLLLKQKLDDNEKAYLYIQIGATKDGQGNYMDALIFYKQALKMFECIFPLNYISLACCHNNIGQMHQRMGDYKQALRSHRIALGIKLNILPSDDLNFAKSYGHIGILYDKLGKYDEARSSHEKAIEIRLKHLPPNHPALAHSYKNLGSVYNNMGEYSTAFLFYNEAHTIMEQTLSSDHPDLAQSYGLIGSFHNKMGNYPQALASHEKALEIRQKSLSPTHSFVANSYNNIGLVYNNMGEHSKALVNYEKALKIYKTTFPLNHPTLANCYNNMAAAYTKMEKYTKALSLQKKALWIYKRTLPLTHSSIATSRNDIGLAYYKLGNYSKALSYYKRAIRTYRNTLSINHPYLAALYSNIGTVYITMGNYSEALSSHENALEIKQKVFHLNHPMIATSYYSIGTIYFKINDYSKALSFYEKAIEIREKNLPLNHNILSMYYNIIGSVYLNMDDYTKALQSYRKVINNCFNSLSSNHPNIINSYYNIGCIYFKTGQYSIAFSFCQLALLNAQDSLPKNHPLIQQYHEKLNIVKEKLSS